MTRQPPVEWFLRTTTDHDTHRGWYSHVTRSVHAVCGIEFEPRTVAFGRKSLPGDPQDPVQICPQCGPVRLYG